MFFLKLRKQFEYIRADKVHPVGKSVDPGILRSGIHGELRYIYCGNMRCAASSGIHGKRPGVGETVKNFHPFGKFTDCKAVILLIKEEARLLSVFHIYGIADAVFADPDDNRSGDGCDGGDERKKW